MSKPSKIKIKKIMNMRKLLKYLILFIHVFICQSLSQPFIYKKIKNPNITEYKK